MSRSLQHNGLNAIHSLLRGGGVSKNPSLGKPQCFFLLFSREPSTQTLFWSQRPPHFYFVLLPKNRAVGGELSLDVGGDVTNNHVKSNWRVEVEFGFWQ